MPHVFATAIEHKGFAINQKRSDFHSRIGEGKFIFKEINNVDIRLELIYFTSVSLYVFIVTGYSAFGIYLNNITMPIVVSIVLLIPIFVRIGYLNANVFKDILECSDE